MQISGNDNNTQLRVKLQHIADTYIGEEAEKQIQPIADLSAIHPHSIRLVQKAITGQPETFRFNCHEYTFDLLASEEVRCIARRYRDIFPGRDFVIWLIENYLTELANSEVQDGDFIVYFSDGLIMHSGLYSNGKVRSKWGLCHLWEHKINEVPNSYGQEFRFFRRVTRQVCITAFVGYAVSEIGEEKVAAALRRGRQ